MRATRRNRIGSPLRTSPAKRAAHGFTLIEIILALAIMAGVIAILTEVMSGAYRNASIARDATKAEILAAGKMAEFVTGVSVLQSAQRTPFADNPDWVFSVEVGATPFENLRSIAITVERTEPNQMQSTAFTLTRWIDETIAPVMAESQSTDDSASGGDSSAAGGSP